MSVIPKEQLGGFQRWQINSFDQKPVVTPIVTEAPPPIQDAVVTTEETINEINLPTAEDIERIHEEARKSGYDAGFEEGKVAAEKANESVIQEAMASVSTLIGNIENALNELDQSVANQVLELALEVARQLTGGTIRAQSDHLLPIIKES